MAGEVRFTWNRGELAVMLHGPSGEVGLEVRRRGNLVLNAARREAPVRTGTLRGSLRMFVGSEAGELAATIGSPLDYALYVHEGTGIYGPRHRPIRPVRARMLAWRDNGQWHFAREVRGTRPNRFLERALSAAM